MTDGVAFGLSSVQIVSLTAGVLTILAMGRQAAVTARREGPELVQRVRLAVREKLARQVLKPFWGSFVRDGCTLVLPTKDHTRSDEQPEWMRTMFLDYFGVAHLLEELNTAFDTPDIAWSRSDAVSREQRARNLISVGGPQPNRVTATLLEQPEIVYRFPEAADAGTAGDYEGRIVSTDGSERAFEPEERDGDVERDVGIITKMENPYDKRADAIVVCGVWGWGTKAGFELLTQERTLDYLLAEGGDHFQAIYTVEIDEQDRTIQPHLLDLHPDESVRTDTIVSLAETADSESGRPGRRGPSSRH